LKPSTREWIQKAEADFLAAVALSRRRKVPLRDHVCFHGQQSAEKYLKARLEEANIRSPKTHDLDKLLTLLLPVEPLWEALRPACLRLSNYAVKVRYPGYEATQQDVNTTLKDCRAGRIEARMALGLTK
jgi:HEPN domain-containing protein